MDRLQLFLAEFDIGLLLPAAMMLAAIVVAVMAVGGLVRERGTIRRRAATVGALDIDIAQPEGRLPTDSERRKSQRMLDYVNAHFVPDDKVALAKLKRQLVQAGYLKPSAIAWYFMARGIVSMSLGIVAFTVMKLFLTQIEGPKFVLFVGIAMVVGYMAPSFWLDRRIKKLADEHRYGFPDFMDLMVVCADSGLAMEAAMERVGRELAATHPSLSANLAMANLEMRAGRRLGEALEHLGDRLGIPEARSFATLLQQSEELGSSMTEALRVYSDDMRHQRLARAEEKAYALPAKLVIPMGLFIFPIVMVVTMLPVIIRLKFGMLGGGQ